MINTEINYTYDKANWTSRIRRIKTFARYGLIGFSSHANDQLKKRGITKSDVMSILKSSNSTIIQCHAPNTYNDNESEVVVIWGKFKQKGKHTKPMHVVLANTKGTYIIVTAYIPNEI